MPTLTEGRLQFTFPEGWEASKYDQWSHYRNQAMNLCGGAKAIDILALAPTSGCWLIEVKDYRQHRRTKVVDLADEVAAKVRDTLAALVGAQLQAADEGERALAHRAVRCKSLRVVLHLEQPASHSKLFPRVIDTASVVQRLKQLLRSIDPHPRVVETAKKSGLPWSVVSV